MKYLLTLLLFISINTYADNVERNLKRAKNSSEIDDCNYYARKAYREIR